MSRPPKVNQTLIPPQVEQAIEKATAQIPVKKDRISVSKFQMVVGVDLVGSKSSMVASKNLDLELNQIGIIARSKNSKRKILIPWTNIKGAELPWDGE